MADKIVVLRDGKVEQIGAPMTLYDSPANLFVASFIGSPGMNFLTGESDGAQFIADDGTHLPLPPHLEGHAEPDLVWGIRPEHLSTSDTGAEMIVRVVEPTGAEIQVIGQLAGQAVTCVLRDQPAPAAGDRLRLQARPEKVHLFRAGSGERLD